MGVSAAIALRALRRRKALCCPRGQKLSAFIDRKISLHLSHSANIFVFTTKMSGHLE
jgi:hypothetical protein